MKKFIQNFAILFMTFGFLLTAQIFGQLDGNPANLCRNGFFPRESSRYQMAAIKGKKGEKIFFYGDRRADCPGGKDCRLKSYLIPTDKIIVSRALDGFACAWFQPKKGAETVGWIKIDNLEWIEGKSKFSISDWLGNWQYDDSKINITISRNRGLLGITGNAIWKGLGENIHFGELDHRAKPTGNKLNLGENETGEYSCQVSMQLVGRYLVVSDNLHCGGVNVTFSGVYQRKTPN